MNQNYNEIINFCNLGGLAQQYFKIASKSSYVGHLGGLGQKQFKIGPKSITRYSRGPAMAPIRNGYNPSYQNWYHPFVIALIRNGCQPSCQNWYHPFVMATAPKAPSEF